MAAVIHTAEEFAENHNASDLYEIRLYPDRESWLQGRKGHLGASDAYKILDGQLRKGLYEEMIGEREHDYKGNDLTRLGQEVEPLVRQIIALENPEYDVYDGGTMLFVSKRYPWASCTLDTILIHRETGVLWNVEQKMCRWTAKWRGEYCPDSYFAQIMHQYAVTGFCKCALHPRIWTPHAGGLVTSFERSYEWEMTDEEIETQVADLMDKERDFMEMVKARSYKPMLAIPSIF